MSSLLPGLHYNLKLQLSEAAAVYVTLVLTQAPGAQHAMLNTASVSTAVGGVAGSSRRGVCSTGQTQPQLLQARFAGCTEPIRDFLPQQQGKGVGNGSCMFSEVWAVWHGSGSSSSDGRVEPLHVEVSGCDKGAAAQVLQHCTEEALGASGRQAMPLQVMRGPDLHEELVAWPPEHVVRTGQPS